MKHEEGYFDGPRGIRIYHRRWLPEGHGRAALVLVHGLAEHSGRYLNLVRHFVPRGYSVYGADHPGHGRSGGARVFVRRFGELTETLRTHVGLVRARERDNPVFLVAHSMGGLIAAMYLAENQPDVAGAVLSGPGLKAPDSIPPAVVAAVRLLSVVAPRCPTLEVGARGVSRDPAVVEDYLGDPLVHKGRTTARLASELLRATGRIAADARKITCPLLIVHGGADSLVEPEGSRAFCRRVGSTDCRLEIYEGLYHEVFNEPEHGRVMKDIEAWLETRLGLRTPARQGSTPPLAPSRSVS